LPVMNRHVWTTLLVACIPLLLQAWSPVGRAQLERPSAVLPASAAALLAASLDAARHHARHIWRDTTPQTGTGAVNAYIEIPKGERRKWEFNMRANERAVDRVMPEDVGGYPVNYGFVPQTVSYDGDPFDVLVLGPALPGGRVTTGVIVGLMMMEDEKGIDSKVVVSPVDANGKAAFELSEAERARIAEYFRIYKRHEPGKFSKVPGWGSAADGGAYITMTHAFFKECRRQPRGDCRIQE
jgi:inorganic pyrophosphatase